MADKDQVHAAHQSLDGKYRWVEGAGGIYRHDQQFFGVNPTDHPSAQPGADFMPMPIVVLRCRCDNPEGHASKGEHCPMAEVDVAETMVRSVEVRDRLMPNP
jgi:hypothetical protein